MTNLKAYHRNEVTNEFSAQRWNKADDVEKHIDELQQEFFKITASVISDLGITFAKQLMKQHDRIERLEKALRGRCTDREAEELGL